MEPAQATSEPLEGLVFDIKRDATGDGPGVRTTVFLKGCPLGCVWCHNPEGISPHPELWFRPERCHADLCGSACVAQCPEGALLPGAPLTVRHAACRRCDRCFAHCPSQALEPVGERYSVARLLERLLIDRPFYRASGGGVTFSGGEPTLQMAFLGEMARRLRQAGISVALETCGEFPLEPFRRQVLPHLDLILFDLKLWDDDQSRRYTGVGSRRILDNFRQLSLDGRAPLLPRIPLVPGITATPENLAGWGRLLREMGHREVVLPPYHGLWRDKPARLGKSPADLPLAPPGFEQQRQYAGWLLTLCA